MKTTEWGGGWGEPTTHKIKIKAISKEFMPMYKNSNKIPTRRLTMDMKFLGGEIQ